MKTNPLNTERLQFKMYEKKDKNDFLKLLTDPLVMKNVGDGVLDVEQAEKLWERLLEDFYPQNIDTIWAVFTKEYKKYVGSASIRPRPEKRDDWEIVYILKQENWRKGLATEIAQKLIDYGFTKLNLQEIFATVDDDNSASIKVLEKSGMKFLEFEYDEQGRFSVYSIKR